MNSYDTLKVIVAANGLVDVLKALKNVITDFESKHGYRRDFCALTNATLGAVITSLETFQTRYGYIAGKE